MYFSNEEEEDGEDGDEEDRTPLKEIRRASLTVIFCSWGTN